MKADPRTEAEVMHVLSRIVETASSRDIDGAMALFADDPNVFLLGTGVDAGVLDGVDAEVVLGGGRLARFMERSRRRRVRYGHLRQSRKRRQGKRKRGPRPTTGPATVGMAPRMKRLHFCGRLRPTRSRGSSRAVFRSSASFPERFGLRGTTGGARAGRAGPSSSRAIRRRARRSSAYLSR